MGFASDGDFFLKILIVKISSLRDTVSALPVLDYLRQVSPGIEIDWVVEESCREIVDGNHLLRKVFPVGGCSWGYAPYTFKTWKEISRLKRELGSEKYAIAFDLQGNFKSGLITWLSGAERRYGFDRDDVRESLNLIFTNNQVPLRRQDSHVSARALRLVSVPFGKDYIGMKFATDIHTSPEDDAAAETFLSTLSDGLVFLFHYGTTWGTKLWSEEGWVKLGQMISAKHPDSTILFSWGNDQERGAADPIAAAIKGNVRLLPGMTLKGLCAFLKKIDLVVGGDTGPVHMAAAVGTPTVSFYRATDEKRNGPKGDNQLHVHSPLHCRACLRKECDRDRECRESITAEAIMRQIEEILGR
jgi:heptosyltransferase I